MTRLIRMLDHPAILPALVIAGLVFTANQVIGAAAGEPWIAYDLHTYWMAGGSDDPYAATIASGFDDSVNPFKYRYPPPLAQVFVILHLVPFPIVVGLWTGMLYAIVLILGGRWAPFVLLFPPTLGELYFGNINIIIALAIVIGFRWAGAWAFVLLTKITPGVGLLWFAFRREWRSLAVAGAVTASVTALSMILAPMWWQQFYKAMAVQAGAAMDVPSAAIPISLPIRLVFAAAIVALAAHTDRAWLVAVAATIAAPALWWNVLVILIACVPLAEGRGLTRPLLHPWQITRLRAPGSTTPARA